jgi:hypothetical protein
MKFVLQTALAYLVVTTIPAIPRMEPYLPPVYVIERDPGGITRDFDAMFKRWSQAGAHVIVEGQCGSSCTRMLFTRYAGLSICAQPGGTFEFHKSYYTDERETKIIVWDSPAARRKAVDNWSRDWLANFPPKVHDALRGRHIPSPTAAEWSMAVVPASFLVSICPATTQSLTRNAPHVTFRNIADGFNGKPVVNRAR